MSSTNFRVDAHFCKLRFFIRLCSVFARAFVSLHRQLLADSELEAPRVRTTVTSPLVKDDSRIAE